MMGDRILGAISLDVDIKSHMLTFWARLCSGDKKKHLQYDLLNIIYIR